MYNKIMVPVDLSHTSELSKSLDTAADLATHYKIPIVFVSVGATAPGDVARDPAKFAQKLDEFARAQATQRSIQASAKAYTSSDPASDVDDTLLRAVRDLGADLVVMASHVPGLVDYVWPSNGGKIAQHAAASVFVVRS